VGDVLGIGVGARGTAIVTGLPAGEARLTAIRVDAAGNASEPTEIVATIPPGSGVLSRAMMPLALVALSLLARRKRALASRARAL